MHVLVLIAALCAVLAIPAAAGTDVLTGNYDSARTGANLAETQLNPANVRPEGFGRQFYYQVDGPVMSQPLVVTGQEVQGKGRRDVVYVATGSNSVYAFDATSADDGPLWRRELTRLPGGKPAAPTGISSTPVIDRAANALYVVAGMDDGTGPRFVVHALDLGDGRDVAFGPVTIEGAVQIDGERIRFQPTAKRVAVQRAGLALARGKLIVAFGNDFFEGWIFALDAGDLRKPADAFCTTCTSRVRALSQVDYVGDPCVFIGPGGGIWQSGRAPAVDAQGKVYFFTSNKQHGVGKGCRVPAGKNACSACTSPDGCVCQGSRSSGVCGAPDACIAHQPEGGSFDVNDALIVLDPGAGLRLKGWFRPRNWDAAGDEGLERNDLDLGASGPLLLPGGRRVIGGGKQGVMYVLDVQPEVPCKPTLSTTCIPAEAVQSFAIAPAPAPPNQYHRHLFGSPVIWLRSEEQGGSRAFVWRLNDVLRSYRVSDRFLDCSAEGAAPTTSQRCTSAAQGDELLDQIPGAMLTLSANAADPASAIVWASAYRVMRGPGRLMAYAAEPAPSGVLPRLWDSDMCQEDAIESGSDFVPPTVANGRVYLAGGANRVEVFGLIENKQCTPVPRVEGPGPLLQ